MAQLGALQVVAEMQIRYGLTRHGHFLLVIPGLALSPGAKDNSGLRICSVKSPAVLLTTTNHKTQYLLVEYAHFWFGLFMGFVDSKKTTDYPQT